MSFVNTSDSMSSKYLLIQFRMLYFHSLCTIFVSCLVPLGIVAVWYNRELEFMEKYPDSCKSAIDISLVSLPENCQKILYRYPVAAIEIYLSIREV